MVAVFSHRQAFFSTIQCIKGFLFPAFAGVITRLLSSKRTRNGAAWPGVIMGDR